MLNAFKYLAYYAQNYAGIIAVGLGLLNFHYHHHYIVKYHSYMQCYCPLPNWNIEHWLLSEVSWFCSRFVSMTIPFAPFEVVTFALLIHIWKSACCWSGKCISTDLRDMWDQLIALLMTVHVLFYTGYINLQLYIGVRPLC